MKENKYKAELHSYADQLDEYQVRIVLGFIRKLFGLGKEVQAV